VTTLVVLVVLVVLPISVPWRLCDRGVVVGEVPLILADLDEIDCKMTDCGGLRLNAWSWIIDVRSIHKEIGNENLFSRMGRGNTPKWFSVATHLTFLLTPNLEITLWGLV
jgi:hypothetical protein